MQDGVWGSPQQISDVPGLLIDQENLNLLKTNSQFQLIWHD